jgi:hypothetical protein
VIHKSDVQFATFNLARRYGLPDVRNKSGRWLGPAAQLPSQQVKQAASLRCIRVIEAPSVEMRRK